MITTIIITISFVFGFIMVEEVTVNKRLFDQVSTVLTVLYSPTGCAGDMRGDRDLRADHNHPYH